MASIHPAAVVENGARLGEGVVVGPFCHVGARVEIGAGSVLRSHVVVAGETRIGAGARIFPFASIGTPSQDLKAALGEGRVRIGPDCVIREGVTINSAPRDGTVIGAGCALLAYSHVAHDCRLGDGVVLANQALLGGHVEIGDYASVGGGAAIHQFVRIGAYAFVGGLAGVEGDVIPFGLASGDRAHLFGLNLVGLRRRGFSPDRVARLKAAWRQLFGRERVGPLAQRIEALAAAQDGDADIGRLVDFLRAPSPRPLCAPRPRARTA